MLPNSIENIKVHALSKGSNRKRCFPEDSNVDAIYRAGLEL